MFDPRHPERITVAENLRDKAWEYLPAKAREAKQLVKTEYWPVGAGMVKLTVSYDPRESGIEITTEETVHHTEDEKPSSYRAFMHHSGVELNAKTGVVIGYGENADVRDEYNGVIESPEELVKTKTETLPDEWSAELNSMADATSDIENEVFYTFTQDKLDYLIGLFDNI